MKKQQPLNEPRKLKRDKSAWYYVATSRKSVEVVILEERGCQVRLTAKMLRRMLSELKP